VKKGGDAMSNFYILKTISVLCSIWIASSFAATEKKSNPYLEERIEQESKQKTPPVEEAVVALKETRGAVDALFKNKTNEAKAALGRAVKKLDAALATHPGLSVVPISFNVQVWDLQADDATIKRVVRDAQAAMTLGRYQVARHLLQNLASEVDIQTTGIPIATYPPAIRSAVRLLENNQIWEAKLVLLTALHNLVTLDETIPLPVLRSQAIVDEVAEFTKEKNFDKARASKLLAEADKQLTLAEDLGYGTARGEFKDLHAAIKDLDRSINKDEDSKGLLARISQSLQSLKSKIIKSHSTNKPTDSTAR
jgi:hypothetical protein